MHQHHHHQAEKGADRSKHAVKVTLIGSAIDLLLGVAKLMVGALINSQALIVDGIHSLSDLFTDGMVLVIAKISHQAPDEDHPYGHERFETLGTVILGGFLVAIAGALVYDSIMRLFSNGEPLENGMIGIAIAAISIISKEWIYRFTLKVGNAINSPLLIANAWHSRSDALSSVVVLVGLLGVIAGFPILDLIAALLVAFLIGKIGWDLSWSSIKQLVDTALPQETVDEIRNEILQVDGVIDAHDLRTRQLGPHVAVDVHVQVDANISVSEGHEIGEWVESRIKEKFPEVTDVVFHIDSKAHQGAPFHTEHNAQLPLRPAIENALTEAWLNLLPTASIDHINLHYGSSTVDVVVFVNSGWENCPATIEQLRTACSDLEWLGELRFWQRL